MGKGVLVNVGVLLGDRDVFVGVAVGVSVEVAAGVGVTSELIVNVSTSTLERE